MRRLLLILVLCLSGVAIMKGEQLVATLQSGDATKVFYGQSAFVEAYAEASDGDVITLSKGNFKDDGVTIEKSITLRGAGAFVEGESTVFQNLAVTADRTVIEGIKVAGLLSINGNKQQLLRCCIETLNSKEDITETSTPSTTDIYIGDCAIKCDGHALSCVNAAYKNCAIQYQAGPRFDEASATYVQCVMRIKGAYDYSGSTYDVYRMYKYGYFYNCILYSDIAGCDFLEITTPNQFYDTIIYKRYNSYFTHDIYFQEGVQRRNCVTSLIPEDEFNQKFDFDKFPYFFYEEVTAPDVEPFICGIVDHKEWPVIPRVVESNIARETDASGHLKVDVKVSCEK